jgi:hypothetical protein
MDPSLGRFTQPDTIVPTSTQGTQAWDRYAFVNNNPVRYTDPTGHDTECGIGQTCPEEEDETTTPPPPQPCSNIDLQCIFPTPFPGTMATPGPQYNLPPTATPTLTPTPISPPNELLDIIVEESLPSVIDNPSKIIPPGVYDVEQMLNNFGQHIAIVGGWGAGSPLSSLGSYYKNGLPMAATSLWRTIKGIFSSATNVFIPPIPIYILPIPRYD